MNNSDKTDLHPGSAAVKGRRDFLAKTAFAGATVALSSVPLAGSQSQATSTTAAGGSSSKLSGGRNLGSLAVLAFSGVEAPPKT